MSDKREVSDTRLPLKSLEKLSDFCLPRGTPRRSRDLGCRLGSAGRRAARTPSGRPHDGGVQIKTWCEGRPHGISAERRAMGGLFPAAPLARHRVEAPATPGVGISVRNTRAPEVMAGGTGASVLSPTCARGDRGDKTPSSSTSRSDPRARRKPGREALGHARLRTCPGLPGRARMGRYGSILGR